MNIQVGSYSGNSTDNRTITGVGFQPRILIIKGDSTAVAVLKTDTITGDNTAPLSAGSLFSGGVKTLDADGFTLGTSTQTNASGTAYYYIALGGTGTDIATGSYTGNGTDNRNITGSANSQRFLLTKATDSKRSLFRTNVQAGDVSYLVGAFGNRDDAIQSITTDGQFQLGTLAEVNGSGVGFNWFGLGASSGNLATGTYTGNGTDNRSITGVGFRPDVVLVKKSVSLDASGTEAVFSTTSMGTDKTAFGEGNTVLVTNRIQGVAADGFEVGTADETNTNGQAYYYLCLKADTPATTTSTSSSTSTTTTSTSTTSTSTSTTSTSTSTTSTSTSTTSTSTSTSTTSTSTTTTSTTTTLDFIFSVEESI